MPVRLVDVIVDGRIVRSEEVSYLRLPWSRCMSDADCIAEALNGLWHDRFEAPANATFRVRDP